MLCREAVRRCPPGSAAFVAVRPAYGEQRGEADARLVLQAMEPDDVLTVDIRPDSEAALAGLTAAGLRFGTLDEEDRALGNIKARLRMVEQYAVAAALDGLVIGTDHAAEAVTGFFTKFGAAGSTPTLSPGSPNAGSGLPPRTSGYPSASWRRPRPPTWDRGTRCCPTRTPITPSP